MRHAAATLVLLLVAVSTFAQESKPKPDTPAHAAEKVLAAIAAKDDAALRALAETHTPDPWLVADELLMRGAHGAAKAFAEAAPRPAVEALPAYVASRVGKADAPEERELLRRIEKARGAKNPARVLEVGEPDPERLDTVVRILIAHLRGVAEIETKNYDAAEKAFERVFEAARQLGWNSRAGRAGHNLGTIEYRRGDYRRAVSRFDVALTWRKKAGDASQQVMTLRALASCHLKLGDGAGVLDCRTRLLALGGDIYWPKVVVQAADLILAAVKAEDGDALTAFAAKDTPDPWWVVDELLSRGEREAALSYALAAPRKDTEFLPTYLKGDVSKEDPARRKLLDDAAILSRAKDTEGVLKLIDDAGVGAGGVLTVRLLNYRAWALYALKKYRAGSEAYQEAARHAERLGWHQGASSGLYYAARSSDKVPDSQSSLSLREQRLEVELKRGNKPGIGRALSSIGWNHHALGDSSRALVFYERALELKEDLDDRGGMAKILENVGWIHINTSSYPKALSCWEQALELRRQTKNRAGEADCISHMGMAHLYLGAYAKAMHCNEQALEIREELGDRRGVAAAVLQISGTHLFLGDIPKGLSYAERYLALMRELGDKAGIALALAELGIIYSNIPDYDRALDHFNRSLAAWKELQDSVGMASTFAKLAMLHELRGDIEEALEFQERAITLIEERRDDKRLAMELQTIAGLHNELGNFEEAISCGQRSLELCEELNDRFNKLHAYRTLGRIHLDAGNHEEAAPLLGKAVRLARRIRATESLLYCLIDLAKARLEAGEPARALAAAQQGLRDLESVLGGLAEDEGASGRQKFVDLYGVGAIAAARLGEPAEVLAFLENGRAGALLETLGSGRVARFANLPKGLLQEQAEAKAAETRAREAHEHALDSGDRRLIRERADALDVAMNNRRSVTARIQREAKRAAEIFYPRAALLEEIQEWMEKGTAVVIYGLCLDEAIALVLRPDDEQVVALGTVEEVEAVYSALVCESPATDPGAALAALGKMLVEPLNLPEDVGSVLVSPAGALGYVPWGALFDVPVTCIPSGTTWVLLREEERDPGKRVLALGDPVYGDRPGDRSVEVYRGTDLQPLPGTREEAKAVGDVVLLGKEATESGFTEALKAERRWRAVHLACHGLLDSERPMRSSLALTPGGGEDGFLTFLDVFGLDIPADLVVLSACETARGKVAKAEGIVGLTRAFMYAGSPRILCSLWQVDDEATRALMVKFYELWNPKEGEGLPASTALMQAQDFIKSHERWKHPIYWAAWVLWGLPD